MESTASGRALIAAAVLAAAAIACNLPGRSAPTPTADAGGVEVTATPSLEAGTAVHITAAPPADEPTSTNPPPAGPDADGLLDCVAPSSDVPTTQPTYSDLIDRAADWLNAGIAPGAIEQALHDLGWIDIGEIYSGGLLPLDADADKLRDYVMLTYNPDEASVFGPPGDAVLYACVEGHYQIAGTFIGENLDATLYDVQIGDITGDDADELLFITQNCGAHTCFYTLQADHYKDGVLSPLPWAADIEAPVSWPYSDTLLEDIDDDGMIEIVVDTGMIGSVGAGPQRSYHIVYGWDGEALAEISREVTSTEHMIHIVNDADELFDAGDYGGALALYQRALDDPDLDRAPDFPYTGWADDLAGYVEMKKMLAYLAINAGPEAQDQYNLLQLRYDNTPYSGYAYLFWNAYQQGGSIPQGCDAMLVQVSADVNAAGMPLNQYGYANRLYEPVDMCPF